MMHQILKITLLLNALMIVSIAALRLLPNDDASIKKLLLPPEGCAAPCFMNVRPGITTRVDAIRLIDKHSWAKSPLFFARSISDMHIRYVMWQWSGQQPSGVDSRLSGQLVSYNDHATSVIVHTNLPLGAVWLVLGSTNQGTLSFSEVRSHTHMLLVMAYPQQGLLVRVVVPKHVSQAVLWQSTAEIESSGVEAMAYFGGYHLPALARLQSSGLG